MSDGGIDDESWARDLFRRALEATPAARAIAGPQREGRPTQRVSHSLGISEVPCPPQRVLCLQGRIDLEACLALGLPVAAPVTDNPDAPAPRHLRGLMDARRGAGRSWPPSSSSP